MYCDKTAEVGIMPNLFQGKFDYEVRARGSLRSGSSNYAEVVFEFVAIISRKLCEI